MGCDIHAHLEQQNDTGDWLLVEHADPFDCRSYGIFGFLADVRNYSAVPPISEERGLPVDVSPDVRDDYLEWDTDAHTPSWLLVSELVEFDYSQEMNDRRVTRQVGPKSFDGGVTGSPEEGTVMTYREFLGSWYEREIERLANFGDPARLRVVFWFDN